MKKSTFSAFLEELAWHSVALDNSVTMYNFAELQKLEDRLVDIINAIDHNTYSGDAFHNGGDYTSLLHVAQQLHLHYMSALCPDKKEV